MLTLKTTLTSLFLIAQAAGASAIVLPIRSNIFREVLKMGLQPGFVASVYLDRFLPHTCFAMTQTQKWIVPLTVFAINCLVYFLLYRLAVSLIRRKRLQAAS